MPSTLFVPLLLLALDPAPTIVAPSSDVPWLSLPQRPLVAPPDPDEALQYEPTPAIVFLSLDGLEITDECAAFGPIAHSGIPCSTLMPGDVTIPPWPNEAQADTISGQTFANFEPFDVVFTPVPPPAWIPHHLVSIGGEAGDLGWFGACGVSEPTCDGLKRNDVGFFFATCASHSTRSVSAILGRMFGLEPVDAPGDLMHDGVPQSSGSTQPSTARACSGPT